MSKIRQLAIWMLTGIASSAATACARSACLVPASEPIAIRGTEQTDSARRASIRRVVLVTIDGLKPESYLHPDEKGLKIPILRSLVAHGATSDGVTSVFPTLTYPSHTSMVTGVNPDRHRIVTNRSFDPLESDLEGWRWYSSEIAVDPIWRLAQRQGLDTAMIHWPVSVGAQVRWLVPEYWRARNTQDQLLLRSISTPGLLESVAREHPDFWSKYRPPQVTDDALTDIALHVLAAGRPSLLMLHLVEVDGAQHRFGIGSPEATVAIEKDDVQLARIFDALTELKLADETAVIVASDHGFRATSKMVRPCVLLADAGLMHSDGGKVVEWKATLLANSGTAYVYIKDPTDAASRQLALSVFSAKQRDAESGISKIYDAEAIRRFGGDSAAEFALEAAPGFQFGPGCLGDYTATPTYHATHGFGPDDAEMRASLLMVGPSIPRGKILNAHIIDIAPTIAKWLDLPLHHADGVPLQIVPFEQQ